VLHMHNYVCHILSMDSYALSSTISSSGEREKSIENRKLISHVFNITFRCSYK
jgi:hypothetical protein